MKWLLRVGLVAFIAANSKIFFRTGASAVIIFIGNLLYNKFEALLLITNPQMLFIPLFLFVTTTILLILWTLISLKQFSSFAESKKIDEVKKSFENKPQSFEDLSDIKKHPKLKTKADKLLNN
jgi:H+/Cl- antiporter ClcA|tara:strand:- start:301 stop:669 length:369 start_codon:yes stop_codon:yes gene_type:complete